jgi:hypothetical protein
MKQIAFSYNWNNKLDCRSFTTFRLHAAHYRVGEPYEILLDGHPHSTAICVGLKTLKLEQVNEFIARLDTGYSRAEFIALVQKMYKNVRNLEERTFCLLLLCKTEPENAYSEV